MRVRTHDRIRPRRHEPARRFFLAAVRFRFKFHTPVHKRYYKLRARFPARCDLARKLFLFGKAGNGEAPAF